MNGALVAGIDGGQSSTVAAIGDETGREIGRGVAGPSDEVAQGPDSTRLRDALRGALAAACAQAGLPPDVRFEAIVAGISGYEGRVYGAPPELPAANVSLLHDAPIAHAGALAGAAGVTVIAGTGAVVYASGGAAVRTLGGWGYLFGDEGGAFWFAREALATMMRRADDGAELRDETHAACAFFGRPSLRATARAVYAGEIDRARVAAFARDALGFESLQPVAARGAQRLSALVAAAVGDGAPALVALSGGMFAGDVYRARVAAAILARIPAAQIVRPLRDPCAGALLLAYRAAGRRFTGEGATGG